MLMADYLDRGVRIARDEPCMIAPDGSLLMTHEEFHDATHRIAAALVADGLQVGDRVAVFSPNDPWAFACVVGVMRAGGIWTALNAGNSEPDLIDFLELMSCSRLIYNSSVADRAAILLEAVPSIKRAVSIGSGRPGDSQLAEWMAPEGTRVPTQDFADSEVALVLGTGGTTGKSKAVPVTHRQLSLMCLAFNSHLAQGSPPRYICATPMTHAAGGAAFPVIAEGGSIVVHQGVVPHDIFDSIERNKVTRIFLPPTAIYALLSQPDVRERDFSSLCHFLVSASPIAPERLAECVEVFGPVMVQVFGQSEAPFICTVLSVDEITAAATDPALRHRLASCGRPSLIAAVELMDDDGNLLGVDQPGEIVVKGDLVFGGYWDNPEASKETQRPGGWHGTGDIGVRDVDGYLYVVDRKKDMIISGGFNVFPSEVEAVIHTFAGVNDCAVIGIPHDKWGEQVIAVIEPKSGAEVDGDAVIAECKARLGSIKAPKEVVFRTLPRSPVGKVLKRELREEWWGASARRV